MQRAADPAPHCTIALSTYNVSQRQQQKTLRINCYRNVNTTTHPQRDAVFTTRTAFPSKSFGDIGLPSTIVRKLNVEPISPPPPSPPALRASEQSRRASAVLLATTRAPHVAAADGRRLSPLVAGDSSRHRAERNFCRPGPRRAAGSRVDAAVMALN